MATAVVCGRENCEELTTSEPFEAVHDAFVRSQNKSTSIRVEEVFNAIRSKLDDVSCAVRISDEVRLDSQVLITVCWVRPENIDYELLLGRGHLMDDLEWSLDLLDLVKAQKRTADATVQTDNFLVNDRSQGQPIEQIVDFVEDRVYVGWLLT